MLFSGLSCVKNRDSRIRCGRGEILPLLRRLLPSNMDHGLVTNVHFPYGVCDSIGRRSYMEDRHVAVGELGGKVDASLYAVFDGHGGCRAAEFCRQHLASRITSHSAFPPNPKEALTAGFLRTDREFLDAARSSLQPWEDGTTVLVSLILGTQLWVAHAGDSRAIAVKADGRVRVLTEDHKPNRRDEHDRIRRLGGSVSHYGVWRVQGVLAVSRAIGDRVLKPFVSAEPEVMAYDPEPDDIFLVLATDGLWDVVSNDQAGQLLVGVKDPSRAARILVRHAINRGTADNITVLVVDIRRESSRAKTNPLSEMSPQTPVSDSPVRSRRGGAPKGGGGGAAMPAASSSTWPSAGYAVSPSSVPSAAATAAPLASASSHDSDQNGPRARGRREARNEEDEEDDGGEGGGAGEEVDGVASASKARLRSVPTGGSNADSTVSGDGASASQASSSLASTDASAAGNGAAAGSSSVGSMLQRQSIGGSGVPFIGGGVNKTE